jgi:type III restriction enzyme
MSRFSLSEHTLDINLRAYDVEAFDFTEIEDYVRALTEGREYQFEAIRGLMTYLWGGRYKCLKDLALENYRRKSAIQQRFQSQDHFLRLLPLPDRLSGVCHLATGTGKSYVIFAVAYLSLILGKVKRVLVLGPSSTVIEQGLTEKFKELMYGARGAELREKLPERYRNRIVKLLNCNDPIEDGSVVIENINAIYGQENNSIGDTLFNGDGDVLVLSDEVHHAYSHLDFSGDALAFDFEEGAEGKGEERDERLWMKFLRSEPRIRRHIGFTGTPYSGNDYFVDVLCEYSIKDATDAKRVKRVNPILHTETDEGEAKLTRLQRFEQILKTHDENRQRFRYADRQGRARLKPITIFICKATASARNNADEFIKVLATSLKDTDPACKGLARAALEQVAREKVICVTSKLGDADYQEKLQEIEQLDPARTGGKVEFIFAVNKLSEGWDVDNVFQIVPMEEKVFNSKLLISQVLGRGLRIPRQVPWVDIQQNFPVVTVTNHEKFAAHINELLDEVTECEMRFESGVFADTGAERAKYNFNLFNLEYQPSVRLEPRSEEEKAGPSGPRSLALTPCAEKLDVKVVYREDTRQFQLSREFVSVAQMVYDIEQKFRLDRFEREQFDFGDGFVFDHVPAREDIERVIRGAMGRIGLEGERLSLKNKQEIELFFYSYLPVGKSKVVRENVEGAVVGVATRDMRRSGLRSGAVEQDASVFVSEDFETELGDQNGFVMKELLGRGKARQGDLGLRNIEGFDEKSIRQLMALKHLYAANTSLFRTPQELVILSHVPERQFMFRLVEHGRWLDSWIKATDTDFYAIDYEYWRKGKDRVRRSFNPDFFIRINVGGYLARLGSEAAVNGVARLRELQDQGIEELIFVVEIKSDDDDSEETTAKESYAREHFEAVNRRLADIKEVLPDEFMNSTRQHYLFSLLRPSDYPGWFSRLKNGLAVVGQAG